MFQGGALPEVTSITQVVMNGGVTAVILWLWSKSATERKEREAQMIDERKASDARFMALLENYKEIVTANTEAMTSLKEALGKGVANCPMAKKG